VPLLLRTTKPWCREIDAVTVRVSPEIGIDRVGEEVDGDRMHSCGLSRLIGRDDRLPMPVIVTVSWRC